MGVHGGTEVEKNSSSCGCAHRGGRGRRRRAVLRLSRPGHHVGRYGAQLCSFLVGACRHGNDGIERGLQGVAAVAPPAAAPSPSTPPTDWPSYNRTVTSERYSQLSEINTKNAGKLKVLCTYDVDDYTAFESGLIMVDNALIGTTEFDIFSLDPATCAENWRTHEDYPPALLPANRGAAYLDGMLFRGTQDGRVLAYDFKTGKRLWETTIADPKRGESVPSAPIAADGLVYVGNAGGDFKGGKGHMFALDAVIRPDTPATLRLPPGVPGARTSGGLPLPLQLGLGLRRLVHCVDCFPELIGRSRRTLSTSRGLRSPRSS